jgi:radical SAM superfamily enzyme YgiQ (UPF0313 family)|tara:strand:+ start:741 stop:932 length:192 start_codon:yes stop_codon:yes gene_type:complete
MTSEEYLKNEFKKLQKTKFGFSVKIFDGNGNATNQMELTPNRAKEILKLLQANQELIEQFQRN